MYEVLRESIDLAALDQGGVDLIAVARDRLSVEMGRKIVRELLESGPQQVELAWTVEEDVLNRRYLCRLTAYTLGWRNQAVVGMAFDAMTAPHRQERPQPELPRWE